MHATLGLRRSGSRPWPWLPRSAQLTSRAAGSVLSNARKPELETLANSSLHFALLLTFPLPDSTERGGQSSRSARDALARPPVPKQRRSAAPRARRRVLPSHRPVTNIPDPLPQVFVARESGKPLSFTRVFTSQTKAINRSEAYNLPRGNGKRNQHWK